MKSNGRRLLALAVMLSTNVVLLFGAQTANAAGKPLPPEPSASVGSSSGSIVVTVTGSGYTQGQGGSAGSGGGGSVSVSVPAPCWMDPFLTGKEYYDDVKSGKWTLGNPNRDGAPSGPWPGYEQHKDDNVGRWYSGVCDSSNWPDQSDLSGWWKFSDLFFPANRPVFVEASQKPPEPPVPPELLRETAIKNLTLPPPLLDWNPKRVQTQGTLVNLDTWFWLDNMPATTLEVRAAAQGQEAKVTVTFGGIEISAPGEAPVSCAGAGTPYTAGARDTSCSLAFSRSSSALGAETTPVSVQTSWTGRWAFNDDDKGLITPQPKQDAITRNIRVDEVQTLVTGVR